MEDVAKHPRLMRRGTTYWFRAKVPVDLLADYAPKKEVTFSLETKDHKEALVKVRIESVKLDQEFAALRGRKSAAPLTTITDAEIERLAALHYHTMLEEDDEVRAYGPGDEHVFNDVARVVAESGGSTYWTPEEVQTESGMSERAFVKSCQGIELVLEDVRRRLARGDTSLLEFEIDDLCTWRRNNRPLSGALGDRVAA